MIRSAKACEDFPYVSKIVCYIGIGCSGDVMRIDNDYTSVAAAYHDAIDAKIRIYAVWPGQYKSDLFVIDDLDALADAYGVQRPDDHRHALEWKLCSLDDGRSAYAIVEVVFECGCKLSSNNIRKFANGMRNQMGWDVAVTKSLSCCMCGAKTEYTIHVRRSSL